jgi:SAM-dependent methyltransferase
LPLEASSQWASAEIAGPDDCAAGRVLAVEETALLRRVVRSARGYAQAVELSHRLIEASGYDRPGFAETYEHSRPRTPKALVDVLCRFARTARPSLVVDLGCGTGLSTRAWSSVARRVVGIEPNAAMLAAAAPASGVEYRQAYAQETGLDDDIADIVTCSQSLHWMDPEATFAEAARILRPGGVFAAYDYDWPPVVDPEVDEAFSAYQGRRADVRRRRGLERGGDVWPKEGHLERMRASGRFRYCREVLLHSIEDGDADRIVGFARSLGLPVADLRDGELERELRIDELERVARRVLGDRTVPFLFGYRVRVGIV